MTALNQNIKQFVATGEKLFIGASVAVGMTVAGTAPAMAAGITGAEIGGNNPNDYLVYDVNGNTTFVNQGAFLDTILSGDRDNPGGNLELFASSETQAGRAAFYNGVTTSVTGQVGGQTLTLSSLNAADWFTTSSGVLDYTYGAETFATQWFTEFWSKGTTQDVQNNGITLPDTVFLGRTIPGQSYTAAEARETAFNAFKLIGGFARSSDANISYAYQENNQIKVGLAGHQDLKAFYTQAGPLAFLADYINDGVQASEVVKYSYNGETGFLYSFNATNSGLLETDGWSHNGNYEATISGGNSEQVPEPIAGLIAAAGLGGAALRRTKKANQSQKS